MSGALLVYEDDTIEPSKYIQCLQVKLVYCDIVFLCSTESGPKLNAKNKKYSGNFVDYFTVGLFPSD